MDIGINKILLMVFVAIVVFFVSTNFSKIKKFVLEVSVELKKVSWSTRKDLLEATWVVMVSSILLGIFIGGTDFVLSKLLGLVIGESYE